MDNIKINIYKKVLQEVCEKFNDAEAFVRERIEELCNKKNYQQKRLTYWFIMIITTFKLFVKILQASF